MNDGEGRGGKGEGKNKRGKKGRESKRVKLQFFLKLKLCDYYSIYYQNNQPLSPTNT